MIAVGMICMAYASVPLYRLFCQVTGFGGTTSVAKGASHEITQRLITIRFNADIDPRLGWKFSPEQQSISLHVGENGLAHFKAVNNSGETSTGTAIYNVVPEKTGKYFNKIQCFCFSRQTIKNGEEVDFPVSFFIDSAFAKDPYMADVDTITLSYTFYLAPDDPK